MYPKALKELMNSLEKLPGIGEKTAERLALHIVSNFSNEDTITLSDSLIKVKEEIRPCKISHILTDEEISPIIKDESRDQSIIMVLADSKDVYMMEKMETYKGSYHVLDGLIDFSRGVTDKELNIDTLIKRINEGNVKELIIATNATVEGELTASFLKNLFEDNENLTLTRLAYGLPVGSDLKYADVLTLIKAVENRRKF